MVNKINTCIEHYQINRVKEVVPILKLFSDFTSFSLKLKENFKALLTFHIELRVFKERSKYKIKGLRLR